jgi:hypothetical protein
MAISYNTGATSSANTATSCNITIPAGVLAGDLMLLGIACFNEVASAPTITITGGGGSWTLLSPMHDGTNPQAVNNGTLFNWAYVYYRVATAGDPGATLTVSEAGSPAATTWLSLVLVSYTGAASSQPDVAGSVGANNVLTVTSPSETTATANDWSAGMLLGGTNGAPVGGLPATSRQLITSGAGISAGIWDSNGSVGGAGTSIGGVTVHGGNNAANNTFGVFTIGLAPAPPPAAPVAVTAAGGDENRQTALKKLDLLLLYLYVCVHGPSTSVRPTLVCGMSLRRQQPPGAASQCQAC